ncbi:tRNA-dihydrouridine(47) synthase [NAD(P)(+)] [Blastocystis sp. ATCC 50177/Nand II]|uniref:tRNA-dihydrouridine(47) synthase [NAD(P)(+)] n=1 Tax=Blastocystis sp. subtype 1 (strain ATCC 50177 / NandII) TaxID=478820 RepID=A0A196SH68_BLAHN|nr:tRNA-dihydrouridine(47) synthase [NAD(P)(+)] [Blastocystis sp. ATCC 50177/Nand II]
MSSPEGEESKQAEVIEKLKSPYFVGINPKYVLPALSNKRSDSVVSEADQGITHKTKRKRADVGLKTKMECNMLCSFIARETECPKGDNCKYSHDIPGYMQNRAPDIGPKCPIWDVHGYCPYGLNCRWVGSHCTEDFKLVAKPKEEQIPIVELNECKDVQLQIRGKKYVFECSSWDDAPVGALGEEEMKSIDFHDKLIVAPLTTVGNLPFRRICVEYGADVTYSEMVMTGTLLKAQCSEWALVRRHPSEKLFGLQLATSKPEEAKKVTELVRREMVVDFVDLNAGCPIDVLERMGAGASLLQRPGKLKRVLGSMLDAAETLPVLCKLRTGDKENTLAKLIPDFQALRGRRGNRLNALTIHGRTKTARYTKTADWDYIEECVRSEVAEEPALQVIGNGDIFDYEAMDAHLKSGLLTSVMTGRGALIKPWLLTELKERRHWDISAGERLEIIKKFCDYGLEHWGSDEPGVARTRRFLLEWMSFLCRYVPIGLLDRPQNMNQRPFAYVGRSDLETLLGSQKPEDWIKVSSMFLGPVDEGFVFFPKHKSNAYIE